MNGKKAKRIRKAVYGNFSQREQRRYAFEHGTFLAVGLRRAYQAAKKIQR